MQVKGLVPQITIGLIFFLVGFFLVKGSIAFKKTALKTNGKIVSYETHRSSDNKSNTYSPVFEYEVSGAKYTGHSGFSSGDIPIAGQEVIVLYQQANPKDARIYSWFEFFGFGLIFAGAGGAILFGGYYRWANAKKRLSEIQEIKRHGSSVMAKVVGIIQEENGLKINGQSRLIVQTSYSDPKTNKIVTFKSDPVWSLPNPMAAELRVFIHPKDNARYYVEIAGLEKLKAG